MKMLMNKKKVKLFIKIIVCVVFFCFFLSLICEYIKDIENMKEKNKKVFVTNTRSNEVKGK